LNALDFHESNRDFLPAPEGAGLPDSSNTFGFIHRLEFDTVRAYCVVA